MSNPHKVSYNDEELVAVCLKSLELRLCFCFQVAAVLKENSYFLLFGKILMSKVLYFLSARQDPLYYLLCANYCDFDRQRMPQATQLKTLLALLGCDPVEVITTLPPSQIFFNCLIQFS